MYSSVLVYKSWFDFLFLFLFCFFLVRAFACLYCLFYRRNVRRWLTVISCRYITLIFSYDRLKFIFVFIIVTLQIARQLISFPSEFGRTDIIVVVDAERSSYAIGVPVIHHTRRRVSHVIAVSLHLHLSSSTCGMYCWNPGSFVWSSPAHSESLGGMR